MQWLQAQHAAYFKTLNEDTLKEEFINQRLNDLKLLYTYHFNHYIILEADELLKLMPDNPDFLLYKAKAHYDLGENFEAKEIFKKLTDEKVDSSIQSEAHLFLGKIHIKISHKEAKYHLNEVIAFNDKWKPRAYFELGNLMQSKEIRKDKDANDYYDEALKALNEVPFEPQKETLRLDIYQQKAEILLNIGHVFRNTNNVEEAKKYYAHAMACYAEILKIDKDNEVTNTNIFLIPQYTNIYDINVDPIILQKIAKTNLVEPTHYEYAYFSNAVYHNSVIDNQLLNDWTLLQTAKDEKINLAKDGYFGAAYYHKKREIIIVAHRGTDTEYTDDLIEDLISDASIAICELPIQWKHAKQFYNKIKTEADNKKATVFITGHSLGAYLGALTAWEFKVKGVIFDPPGSLESIQMHLAKQLFDPIAVPVITYLSYPDVVNTAGHHVGDVKHIPILLSVPDTNFLNMKEIIEKLIQKTGKGNGRIENFLIIYLITMGYDSIEKTLKSNTGLDIFKIITEAYQLIQIHLGRHSMKAILDAFNSHTGMPIQVHRVIKWPYNANQMMQYEILHRDSIDFPNGLDEIQRFKLKHVIHYEIAEISPNSLHVREFDARTLAYLQEYKQTGNNPRKLQKEFLERTSVNGDQIITHDLYIFETKQYLEDSILENNEKCSQETIEQDTSFQQQEAKAPSLFSFIFPGAERRIISPDEEIVQTSGASRLSGSMSSLFVLPIILIREAKNLLPTFSTVHSDVKQDKFEQAYEAPKDGETMPNYSSSTTEQLLLLQCGMHYLTSWLPSNQERLLATTEINRLKENKTKLEALYDGLADIQSGIVADSHLFDDRLNWLDKTIREMCQKINSILKKQRVTQSKLDDIHNKTIKIEEMLANLAIKEEELLSMERQSSVLSVEGKRHAITYDCIQDVLKFKIEKIEPGKNISFSPLAFSQNTRFSQQQQFWARCEMPMLIEAVVDALPTAAAAEDMGQLPKLGY